MIMHGQTHRVESPRSHRIDIDLPGLIRQPRFIERGRTAGADQLGDPPPDAVLRTRTGQLQHIGFLQHPATQPHATQDYFLAFFIDDRLAFGLQKALASSGVPKEDQGQVRNNTTRYHVPNLYIYRSIQALCRLRITIANSYPAPGSTIPSFGWPTIFSPR